jgi:cathepsin L
MIKMANFSIYLFLIFSVFFPSIFCVENPSKSSNDLDVNTSFSKFLSHFYPFSIKENSEEWKKRKEIFEENIESIKIHNNKKSSYKIGINKYSASTKEEKKKMLGKRIDMENEFKKYQKHVINDHSFEMKPVSELPIEVDWRKKGLATAAKDQGHCGSCFAFAASEMLESYLMQSTGYLFNLSPQQGASCAPNPEHCGGSGGCEGGTAEIIFDYIAGGGAMSQEYQYGYVSYDGSNHECITEGIVPTVTIEGYTWLEGNNYTELMNAVAQVGPISIGVDASEWHNYQSGVFNGCNQENPDVNHAVVLMGYGVDEESGEKYWLVRNSWSPTYGEHGYIRLYRDDNESENCGIQKNPQDNDACEGDHKPRKVCGTCGILAGSSYLRGVQLYSNSN